ncbi:MAG: putative porin, partial [Opitutaceae bacterium]
MSFLTDPEGASSLGSTRFFERWTLSPPQALRLSVKPHGLRVSHGRCAGLNVQLPTFNFQRSTSCCDASGWFAGLLLALVFCVVASPIAKAASEAKEGAPSPVAEKTEAASEQIAPSPAEPAAQTGPADLIPTTAGANAPSLNVTINLIKRMVEKGLLTKEDAVDLLKQAEADAAIARVQIQQDAIAAAQLVVAQAIASGAVGDPVPMPDDAVRITYIPESVKKQIRDEIRTDVMAKAKNENWAAPNKLPGWVTRFRVSGDLRIRGESDMYPSGNDNTGAFPNFNAINTGAPFDTAGTVFSPQLNVDQDRTRIRLRARIGAEIEMGDGFTAGLRIATGDSNSPTSTNQSLGLANSGQGGQFSKYSIWLDRGFLKYEVGGQPGKNLALLAGRFDNPFYSTDLIYDEDVGFDGGAVQASYEILKGLTPFFNGGVFPVFNTDFNFSSNQPAKFKSTDKWLYGAQAGFDWKLRKDL